MKIINNNRLFLPAFSGMLLLLMLLSFSGRAPGQAVPKIQKIEYFFDTDPGLNSGVAVPVTPSSEHLSDFSFNIDISGLNDGFHKLFVRAQNENGVWSLTNQRAFYKNTLVPVLHELTKVEYYFDTDPGFGNGADVPITSTAHLSNLSFSIDLTSLADGFYHLYVRARNSIGEWSLNSRRAFLKNTMTLNNPLITQVEYYIGNDPGFGLATSVPVNPNGNNINIDFVVDLTSLPDGFHNFYARAKDDQGFWSLTSRRSFLKKSVFAGDKEITVMEYFFDSDPGLGLGTSIPVAASANVEVLDYIIDLAGLPAGMHKLFVRAKNEDGAWSLTNAWNFYKAPINESAPNIVAAEYYFNNDPGVGSGISISLPGNSSDEELDVVIDLSELDAGFNRLFIRTKDATGRWSHTNSHTFYNKPVMPSLPDIVYAEYFIDTDPGFGSGISIPIPNPGPHLTDIVFEVDETQLIMGNHLLFVRTLDEYGHWSLTLLDEFCRSPKPNFSAAAVFFGSPNVFVDLSEYTDEFTLYFWDVDGNGTTDYTDTTGFSHLYAAPGTYNARLILVSQEGCSDTIVKPVYVYDCMPPSQLQATNISQNTATLSWLPANIEQEWTIEYGLAGFIPGNGTTIENILSSSYLLTGLASGVEYDFYVQSVCGLNYFSNWAGPSTFETLAGDPCINPTDGGSVASSQIICAGSVPLPFSSVSLPTGHTGELQYQWQISVDNIVFEDISGAVAAAYSYPGALMSTTWFRRLAKVSCEPGWTGAATSNVLEVEVVPTELYRTKASGNWNNASIWEYYDGSQWVDATDYPGYALISCATAQATVRNGHTVTITSDVTFGNIEVVSGGTLIVSDAVTVTIPTATAMTVYGSLTMHGTALVNGLGNFTLAGGSSFYIGSVSGVYISSMLGHIQVSGTRWYASGAYYYYTGLANQITGDAISQNIPAGIIVNTTYTVTLSVTINVNGNIEIVQGSFDAGSYNISLGGSWINNGTFVPGSSTVYFTGSTNVFISVSHFYNIVFGGTGTVTANGALTILGSVIINNHFSAGSYVHYVYGNWTNNGTFVHGTSTIDFTGTGNIVVGASNFYNILFNSSGFITAGGSLAIIGDVTINSNFNAGTYVHSTSGNWVNNGSFIQDQSTIEWVNTTPVTIGESDFYNVIFNGSGTVTATGDLNFFGDVTINTHFNAGSFTHYIYGNWINNGTFVPGTSTIHFSASVNIFISVSSFYNVVFAGTGTITATGSLTILGDISITNHFNAGSFTHYVYGNWINTGTFIHGTSTIEFVGSLNIFISVTNFYHVVFAGSGTITATSSLTIYGNITITHHFHAGSYIHYIHGNWINNGTFVAGSSRIVFIGSTALQTISGSATTTFYFLEVDKGLRSRILEVLSPISITATFNNWLVITSGTFKLSYASTIYPFFDESQAVIPAEGGFWNNGGIITGGSFSWHVYGLIRVSLGIINIGTVTGNSLYYYNGSEINVEGGELVVATALRAFTVVHTVNFYMSGGVIIVANIGNATEYASFWIPATGSLFAMSGGTIIVRFNSTHGIPVDYHNVAGTVNISGGIVQFADATVGGSRIYRIGTGSHNIMPGLVLVNAGVSTTVLFNNTVRVYGSVLINEFTTLNVNNFHLWVGINWTNYGSFVYGMGTVEFFGSASGNISASEFYHVIFSGSGTKLAIGSLIFYGNVTISQNFNGGAFTHYVYGNWTNTGNFVYGTSTIHFVGSASVFVSGGSFYHVIFGGTGSYTATGSITFYGNVTIAYHFHAGSYIHYVHGNWINNGTYVWGTSTVVFNGTVLQTIGGSNPTEFYGFTVNNAMGLHLHVNVTVHYWLTLTLGIITTDVYSLTLLPAADITGGSVTAYVNGLLIRGFATTGGKFFPVGNISHYRPMTFTYVSLTGISMVEVQLVGSVIPGIVPGHITTLSRYWNIAQTGGSDYAYTVTLDDEDLTLYLGHVRILQCAANVTVHATTTPDYTNVNAFTSVTCVALGIEPCSDPEIPLLSAAPTICYGEIAELEVLSGELNDAATWFWYSDSCGGELAGMGQSIMVMPQVTTTYYVRGESPCLIPGGCASVTVTVDPLPVVVCPDGFCITADEVPFLLPTANPTGGIYSGPGVSLNESDQYIFTPEDAGEGTHVLFYVYTHPVTGCVDSCFMVITVGHIPYDLHVQDTTLYFGSVTCFNACNTITVEDLTANPGSISTFIAGNSIRFLPGTHFKNGSISHAYLSTNGIFCEGIPIVASNKEELLGEEQVSDFRKDEALNGWFRVYPNPTTGIFNLEFSDLPDGAHSIQIFGSLGNQILNYELKGEAMYLIDLTKFPPGLYFVRLISNSKHEVVRIIKQ